MKQALCKLYDTQTFEITRKSLFTLHHSELAWMEQSEASINAHIYHKILSFTLLVLVFLYRNPFLTMFLVWLA